MPIVIINQIDKDKPNLELLVSEKDAQKISDSWQAGAEVIVVNGRPYNTKYIIGIVGDQGIALNNKRLPEPKQDKKKIGDILDGMRSYFKKRGIIK